MRFAASGEAKAVLALVNPKRHEDTQPHTPLLECFFGNQ
jgi:hypothetical protein